MDHHSHWGSVAELRAAFARFAAPAAGLVAAGRRRPRLDRGRRPRSLGFDAEAPGPPRSSSAVPGRHNLLNARAALAASGSPALDVDAAAAALAELPRRPPSARAARARAAGSGYMTTTPITRPRCGPRSARCASSDPERLIAVFQPHLYSRTKAFAEQFGAALALADEVAVLDVYPAREEPVGELAGVSGLDVARAAADRMGGRRVWWLPDRAGAARLAGASTAPGLGPGRGAGHDRRRRHLRARRGAGRRRDA